MDLELSGKRVLITGGSKGIGLSCAEAFLREGAAVAICSRDAGNLERAKASLQNVAKGVITLAADLIDAQAAQAMVRAAEAKLGPIDILVTSAGAAKRTPPDELTPAAWRDAMDAKYFSYVNVIDPVVKLMAQRGQGVIVNVIGAGGKVASPIHLPGGAANAALMLVTAGLANAYGPRGLRVVAVNPGATLTDRLKEGLAAEARMTGASIDELTRKANARSPLGRMARPEEIADTVLYLASARASYVTGAIVAMDGAVTPVVV